MTRGRFSNIGGTLLRAYAVLSLVVLAYSLPAPSRSIAQAVRATAGTPARISVSIPPLANAGSVALELAVRDLRAPASANIGVVVRLKRAAGGRAVEVGRFSLFASNADEEQRFQFNVTSAVRQLELSGGQAEVEVALVDRSGGKAPSGAELTVGPLQIGVR